MLFVTSADGARGVFEDDCEIKARGGIRGVEGVRGLGDVYKGQHLACPSFVPVVICRGVCQLAYLSFVVCSDLPRGMPAGIFSFVACSDLQRGMPAGIPFVRGL